MKEADRFCASDSGAGDTAGVVGVDSFLPPTSAKRDKAPICKEARVAVRRFAAQRDARRRLRGELLSPVKAANGQGMGTGAS